jgi:hypothetical protein
MKTRLTLAFAVLALTLGIARTAPAAADPCLSFCAIAFCPTGGCGVIKSNGQIRCGCFDPVTFPVPEG